MPTYDIRPATRRDGDQLVELVRGLRRHQGDSFEFFDAERFLDDAFGAEPQFQLLVAASGDELAGYALFHDAYEPEHAARGVYLCDLFVAEHFRRHGIGRALLAAVARDADARGRTFVWWLVREGNDGARAFYRSLGDLHERVTAHALAYDAFARLL